jgi:cytochrome c-type biogenesis protein CcmH/NrfF
MANGRSGRPWLLGGIAVLLVACGVAAADQQTPADAQAPQVAQAKQEIPDSVPGVDMSPLSSAQKAEAMKLFVEQKCDCGCGFTIYDCRTKDQTCGRSPQMAAEVVRLMAQGKSSSDVLKAVWTASAQAARPAAAPAGSADDTVFDVPEGDSYSIGPEAAPVRLVTWLDYQ